MPFSLLLTACIKSTTNKYESLFFKNLLFDVNKDETEHLMKCHENGGRDCNRTSEKQEFIG